jgi:hypothetical protein
MTDQNQHRAPDEWIGQQIATARSLVRDIGNRPVTVEGSFDYCGKSYSYKTEAEPAADALDVDRVLALQDQIRDGSLTLADALKDINGEPIERTRRTTYLVEKIRVRMIQEQKNSNSWQAVAKAVLREVAEWLQENPGPNSAWRAVARDLMDEANL